MTQPTCLFAFALTISPVSSEFNVCYLDDGTFAGPVNRVVDVPQDIGKKISCPLSFN